MSEIGRGRYFVEKSNRKEFCCPRTSNTAWVITLSFDFSLSFRLKSNHHVCVQTSSFAAYNGQSLLLVCYSIYIWTISVQACVFKTGTWFFICGGSSLFGMGSLVKVVSRVTFWVYEAFLSTLTCVDLCWEHYLLTLNIHEH